MDPIDETQRTSFDRIAALYDAARPSYPEALVEEAVQRSRISRAADTPWSPSSRARIWRSRCGRSSPRSRNTHSDHAQLAPEVRGGLYDAIASAIERNGGRIEVPYVAVLLVARLRSP